MLRVRWIELWVCATATLGVVACGGEAPPADGSDAGTSATDSGSDGRDGSFADAGLELADGGPPAGCGDLLVGPSEACDDGNNVAGDGCDALCRVETGYACESGSPSRCSARCGDGLRVGDERAEGACDDGNAVANDGCSPTCLVEVGYLCDDGEPSVCVSGCGNGAVVAPEVCDDGNNVAGDGCSAACAREYGFTCTGSPSVCAVQCGNGETSAAETCDDGNTTNDDGCNAACIAELGYACAGSPSVCAPVCGDGIVIHGEACDDGNTVTEASCATYGDTYCWVCNADCSEELRLEGSVCGDGVVDAAEECDDGYVTSGDGCSSACRVESGFTCVTGSSGSSVCSFEFSIGAGMAIVEGASRSMTTDITQSCTIASVDAVDVHATHGGIIDLSLLLAGPTLNVYLFDRPGYPSIDSHYWDSPRMTDAGIGYRFVGDATSTAVPMTGAFPEGTYGTTDASGARTHPFDSFVGTSTAGRWRIEAWDRGRYSSSYAQNVSSVTVRVTCQPAL